MEFLIRRMERARAEIWPARRSGLPASAEVLRVYADAKCTHITVRPHLLGYPCLSRLRHTVQENRRVSQYDRIRSQLHGQA